MLSPPIERLCISEELMQNDVLFKTTFFAIYSFKMMKEKHMLSPHLVGYAFLTNCCKMTFSLKPQV